MISIAVTTSQRPGILSRALDSFIRYSYLDPDFPGITVFDDSPGAEEHRASRLAISCFRKEYTGDTYYVASPAKEAFAGRLADGNADVDKAMEFCFNGLEVSSGCRGAGANRNSVLLFTAGTKVVSFDDDTFLPFFSAGDILRRSGAESSPRQPPILLFSQEKAKHLESMLQELQNNPFSAFEEVLGKSAAAAGSPEVKLSGDVKIAMSGVFGGRWFSSPHAIFGTPAAAHRFLWKNRKEYEAAKRDPVALMQVPDFHYSADPFLVTTCFGYDGSTLLPPFFPNIRNEDGVWALLVRCMYPNSPICHLPFAVSHDRSVHAPFGDDEFKAIPPPSASKLLLLLFEFFYRDLRSDSAVATLRGLGSRLASMADLKRESFRDLLTELLLISEGRKIRHLRERLDEYGGRPSFLVKDLDAHISQVKRSLEGVQPWKVRDIAFQSMAPEELLRSYFISCGELMCVWPEIWHRAVQLRAAGEAEGQ